MPDFDTPKMRPIGIGVPYILNDGQVARLLHLGKTRHGRIPAHAARHTFQYLLFGNGDGLAEIVVLRRFVGNKGVQAVVAAVELNHYQHVTVGGVTPV